MTTKSAEAVQYPQLKNIKADDVIARKEWEQQQALRRLVAMQARGQSDQL